MKVQVNCLLSALLAVSQLSDWGYARSFPHTEEIIQNTTAIVGMQEITKPESLQGQPAQNATTIGGGGGLLNAIVLLSTSSGRGGAATAMDGLARNNTAMDGSARNTTAMDTLGHSTQMVTRRRIQKVERSATTTILPNSVRRKRAMRVEVAYDFHTTHSYCDFDDRGRHHLIWFMPNHCIWVWNNKYSHEGFYRFYKLYQTEAFFFGQWYETQTRRELK